MKLSFATRNMRRTCLEPEFAAPGLDPEVVSSLQARLADLDAADYLTDIPIGIDLEQATVGRIPIHILDNYYLIGRADHVKVYGSDSEGTSWDKVSRIQLTHIEEMPR